MPELYTSMPSKRLATESGANLAKISLAMVIKYGTHVSLIEAKNMLYVAKNTSIPVLQLVVAYAYGPLDRDIDDFGSVYATYLFMQFINSKDLEKS
ncbi:hypothetical protein BDW02DRAFT_642124 [Decorospora gaudefroyi]|uniref:Uncharacterized protein n=1 Tax=Decorospora gaudefroyi TaxID=184978 RepID=A0A6A5KAU0_9PLEO|nr:hypothetical protein BDW02DRAFT_642124 [Decorospora gaudefroyi]